MYNQKLFYQDCLHIQNQMQLQQQPNNYWMGLRQKVEELERKNKLLELENARLTKIIRKTGGINMTLENVIAELRSGSKSEFVYKGCWKVKLVCNKITFMFNNSIDGSLIPLDGWEEIKPKREWSEKELALFKLMPKNINWIAADKNEEIWVYDDKPKKAEDEYHSGNGDAVEINIDFILDFISLTFEEGPQYIGDLKGE